MRVSAGSPLHQTLALRDPDTVLDAIAAITAPGDPTHLDGLVELIYDHETAPPAVAAIRAVQDLPSSALVDDALANSLNSKRATVRMAAIEAIAARRCDDVRPELNRILRTDRTWMVRRAALECLAAFDTELPWSDIFVAADDPHWRVRHALINVLLDRGADATCRDDIISRLRRSDDVRTNGVVSFLLHRWQVPGAGVGEVSDSFPQWDPWLGLVPEEVCPFWDWDPVVLARTLHELGRAGRREMIDSMPALLFHGDERVRRPAAGALEQDGDTAHIVAALKIRDEPRHEGNVTLDRVLTRISMDRLERAIAVILAGNADTSPGRLAWAITQVGLVMPFEEAPGNLTEIINSAETQPVCIREAICQLARHEPNVSVDLLLQLISDSDSRVRRTAVRTAIRRRDVDLSSEQRHQLQRDESPRVRAAAMLIGNGMRDFDVVAAAATDKHHHVRAVAAKAVRMMTGEDLRVVDEVTSPSAKGLVASSTTGGRDASAARLQQTLQSDGHPFVRAEALDEDRARELLAAPESETSWRVLRSAARLLKTPSWEIEPESPWVPPTQPPAETPALDFVPGTFEPSRPLVSADWKVCPVGLSGHYGLPVVGYSRAAERGVNLMFWEPNYQTLTDFSRRLSGTQRDAIGFTAGTFEATPERIRKDVDRALSVLRLDSLALFLVFWVRSWRRIPDDVIEELERMRDAGLIRHFGLSTHSRTLAVEAIRDGWNPVMVRHSAVHRKAEHNVFPVAREHGTSILTFSNTCYGRLLQPTRASGELPEESGTFTAADCYRYTLEQPPVVACWTAPSTLEQLDENLEAMDRLEIDQGAKQALLRRGEWLYKEETLFRKLIRER